jgi:hypothetical protein
MIGHHRFVLLSVILPCGAWCCNNILYKVVTKVYKGRLTQRDVQHKLRYLLWTLQQILRDLINKFIVGDRPQEGSLLRWRFNITLLSINIAVLLFEPDFPDDLTSLTPGELETTEVI